ncbi:hypothetical protein JB92DRAFT_1273815 [Gautieria morchelliformis]|nr:hypothetical protein JB92DRAFT_1273815 [Gautieria morchelliformis]
MSDRHLIGLPVVACPSLLYCRFFRVASFRTSSLMPFCDISNDKSLHYITNTPQGDALDLNPDKAVILLLPHNVTDVTWLREQFRDPRLSSRYNLVGIDLPHLGRSKAPVNAKQDAWVDAADIAMAHELLRLPQCHVFASGATSCASAMCFAVVFPKKCLSLFLSAFPVQRADVPDWIVQDKRELAEFWCFPPDLETFHLATEILVDFFLNNQASLELQNELAVWWQRHYPPAKREMYITAILRSVQTPQFSDKEFEAIQVPTLFVQGDKALVSNPKYIDNFVSNKLPKSTTLVVQGGPECLTIVPEYASVVNRAFAQFLGKLSHRPPCQVSPPDPQDMCRTALGRLAVIADEPDIAQRDPTTTLAFSRASTEDISVFSEYLARCVCGGENEINPLDEHGEPIMKFAEKIKEEGEGQYIRKVKMAPMAAEAEIVRVESQTVWETEP